MGDSARGDRAAVHDFEFTRDRFLDEGQIVFGDEGRIDKAGRGAGIEEGEGLDVLITDREEDIDDKVIIFFERWAEGQGDGGDLE